MIIFAFFMLLIISLSLFLWLILIITKFNNNKIKPKNVKGEIFLSEFNLEGYQCFCSGLEDRKSRGFQPVSPFRLLLSLCLPLYFCYNGLKKKNLNTSGALLAFLFGFVLTLSSYAFIANLLVFYLIGSKATRWRADKKCIIEEDYEEGSSRNWLQVICNGGTAVELSLLYIMEIGCREMPVDFKHMYNVSFLSTAILGAIACSCGDTLSSEIGSVVGNSNPRLLFFFREVPRGTNGATSIVGSLSSILGGIMIGLTHFSVLFLTLPTNVWLSSPPQWPLIPLGAFAGLVGSTIDSILGATLQLSVINKRTGKIVKNLFTLERDAEIIHISGISLLDNHSVNLVASIFTAAITSISAFYLYKYIDAITLTL